MLLTRFPDLTEPVPTLRNSQKAREFLRHRFVRVYSPTEPSSPERGYGDHGGTLPTRQLILVKFDQLLSQAGNHRLGVGGFASLTTIFEGSLVRAKRNHAGKRKATTTTVRAAGRIRLECSKRCAAAQAGIERSHRQLRQAPGTIRLRNVRFRQQIPTAMQADGRGEEIDTRAVNAFQQTRCNISHHLAFRSTYRRATALRNVP